MQEYKKGYHINGFMGAVISFLIIMSLFNCTICTGQDQSIGIEVTPMIVESYQNFSVSVYDSSIQNGTPYLVGVTILFNDAYYEITPDNENGELILTAPEVLVNRTYEIEAYYNDQIINTSILVKPQHNVELNELILTIDTYTVEAFEPFIVLITDKNGQPIENALVFIEQSPASQGSGITNSSGKVELVPPNKENIIIQAEKQGYETGTKTISVVVESDLFDFFITHPYTPIIGSILVLFVVIIYVTLSNLKKQKGFFSFLNKNNQRYFPHRSDPSNKSDSLGTPDTSMVTSKQSNQIEEILIRTRYTKTTNPLKKVKPSNPHPSHRWFHKQNKEQKKQLNKPQKPRPESGRQTTEEIHKKIDAVLAEQEKKSKKPSF